MEKAELLNTDYDAPKNARVDEFWPAYIQWMGNSVKVVERYYAGLNPEDEDIKVFEDLS